VNSDGALRIPARVGISGWVPYNGEEVEDSSVAAQQNQQALIDAAKGGDHAAFGALVEPLSRELSAYAYRMVGGYQDAEDALQETRLKAWRHLGSYEPSASFRAWLYRIATNTCLDMLRQRQRRVLPPEVGPAVAPGPPTTAMREDISWLEPYPDSLLPTTANPEETLRLHQSIRLAFVRAMQVLPPRQRAALILHDVLDFAVSDVASMLETTVPAINSALQRARATIERTPSSGEQESSASAHQRLEAQKSEMVSRFVRAWETGDFSELVSLLTQDAVLTMPPWLYWLDGKDAIVATMLSPGTWDGAPRPGRYRIVACGMNGQPAGLAYVRFGDGPYVPVCLTVMTLAPDGRICCMDTFVLPKHFTAWGFPAALGAGD
jgi:RNA polymerase sigma-70 factor, ECF subfamily